MILVEEIEKAAKEFVATHSPNLTERDVNLIISAMCIGADLGIRKVEEICMKPNRKTK
jgi:hypothetical protein